MLLYMTVRIYRSARIKSVFSTKFRQNCGDRLLDVESLNIARYKTIKVLFVLRMSATMSKAPNMTFKMASSLIEESLR